MEVNKGGRPPKRPEDKSVKYSSSLPADLFARLRKYCDDEERDLAYAIKNALDPWLKKKGY